MISRVKNVEKAIPTKYVTVSEAARHWRVSRNTIYDACREKEIDFIKIRTSVRVLIDLGEEYLTVGETADYLQTSPSTIYAACAEGCQEGPIPHIRIRSRIRIPRSRLLGPATTYLAKNSGELPPIVPPLQPVVTMGHCLY